MIVHKNQMKEYFSIGKVYFMSVVLLFATILCAYDGSDENECPIVMPNFDDMVLLTREERIRLMDQALRDALSQVQDCKQRLSDMQNQNNNNAADTDGSDNSDGESTDTSVNNESDGENDSEAEQSNTPNQAATPSSELSGTAIPAQQPPANLSDIEAMPSGDEQIAPPPSQTTIPSDELSGSEPVETEREDTISESSDNQPLIPSKIRDNKKTLDNGKLPEDIPPANNDDIIAGQIRAAALAEPDPQRQAKLWNEYRRYKGLPEK